MKAKHLFFAMALPGLFAACTQEEWTSNEANNSLELAKRHNAGVVEFTIDGDEAETRFNHELGRFDNGEEIDLYLMDELTGYCDDGDANHMHGYNTSVQCWKYFNVWDELYTLKDYAQTRYPFAYDETSQTWKNCATLLEGNYFAMHPSNEKITNRKDVWHYINPVQGFSKDGEFYKLAMDNQFWLGYTPIYRDEDRTGEMTLPLSMQPVMTVLKLNIGNKGNTDVIVDKIVFKDGQGRALPTIAYVNPTLPDDEWRKTVDVENPKTADGCGDLTCNGQALDSEYSREQTWPGTSTGRATARSIVEYATPADHIPYGLEDTNVAYEYIFNFDEASDLGGHFLKGNVDNGEYVTVYFPLPHNLGDIVLEPVIYGRIYDKPNNTWKYGILRKGDFTSDNGSRVFTLDQAFLGKLQPYAQEVTAAFDEMGFEAINDARIESTEDLMRYLKGLETSYTSQENDTIETNVYGNGLVINDEVISYLDEMNSKNDCFITLDFKALNTTDATVMLDTEKESMKYFNFGNGTINFVVNKGIHSLEKVNQNLKSLAVEENAIFNVKADAKIANTENNGILNVAAKIEGSVENHKTIELQNTLRNSANIDGIFTNENIANVVGTVTVKTLINKNTCVNCGVDKAVLTITNAGTLDVQDLTNDDKIVNNGILNAEELTNNGTIESNATSNISALTNKGTFAVNAGVTTLTGENSNEGTINVAAGAKLSVKDDNTLANQEAGVINVEGDLMENIQNSGIIYVIGDGHVGVNGVVADSAHGIIDISAANNGASSRVAKDVVTGKAGNYFRYTVKQTIAADLKNTLAALISDNNYGKNPVILVWNADSPATFGNTSNQGLVNAGKVERVIIERELTLIGTVTFNDLNNNCNAVGIKSDVKVYFKAFQITSKGKVIVDNAAKLVLNRGSEYSNIYVSAWVDGTLKVNNTGALDSTTPGLVKVFGAGRCEFGAKPANYSKWIESGEYIGEWLVED